MKTLFAEQHRTGLLARVERVTSDTQPTWGKMNAQKMLAHLVESMRMAIGELEVKPKKLPIRFPPLRELLVYWLPWPKGSPTAPELLPSNPRTVEESKRELQRLVSLFAERGANLQWPRHPAFGNLGRKAWGVLTWRHIDHHLRQFGV